jgi:hypothetical protein
MQIFCVLRDMLPFGPVIGSTVHSQQCELSEASISRDIGFHYAGVIDLVLGYETELNL